MFGLAFVCHFALLVRLRATRIFQGLLSLGCLMEVVGYGFRVTAHCTSRARDRSRCHRRGFELVYTLAEQSSLTYSLADLCHVVSPFKVVYFVIQYFTIVVAPVFFSAAFYLALSLAIRRLPYGIGHGLLSFSPRIFVGVFIAADVVTTVIQIAGAALIGVSESSNVRGRGASKVSTKQANDILLAGLSIQTASFLAFMVILSVVTWRANMTRPTTLPRRFTFLLIFTSLLVMLRTVFRLAETAQGESSVEFRLSLAAGLH